MHIRTTLVVSAALLAAPAMADGTATYKDADGAIYTILQQRPFTDTLVAAMVEIENDGSVILMEMALDCAGEQYSYLGMIFDVETGAERATDIARVEGYSNSLLTDRIGGVRMTALDANLENDSVVALFDMGCGR